MEAKADVAQRALCSRIPGGIEAFDEVLVELHGRPVSDPASFGESQCFLRIAVRGKDKELVGRRFSSAVVETGLSSYPGSCLTGPTSSAQAHGATTNGRAGGATSRRSTLRYSL